MKQFLSIHRIHSLRWRLLAAICAVVLLIWLLTAWFSYTKAQNEAEELMDGSLAQSARLLLAIVHDNEDDLVKLAPRLAAVRGSNNIYEPPLEFQIGWGDGTVLARSPDAPQLPILGVLGYSDIIRPDKSWRVLNANSEDDRYRIQVAHEIGVRDRAAFEVAAQTVLPLILITPVLILFIFLSIKRALRPLNQLTQEVSGLTPDSLVPLSREFVPTEVRPLVNAVNRLLRRVERTLDNERRFTADAAHELCTPLAALKVHAQVALMAGDTPVREHALQQIANGVDRSSHLVGQLLRLARLDPLTALPENKPVDVAQLVNDSITAVQHAHPESGQQIIQNLPAAIPQLLGDPDLLGIALRNLIDNAVRYTPDESTIHIELQQIGDIHELTVRDSGPGIPAIALSRLGERFFRANQAAGNGNGLGLAIVGRIAELHGASLVVENLPAGGLSITLRGLCVPDTQPDSLAKQLNPGKTT